MALREKTEYAVTVGTLTLCRILSENAVYALFKGFALLMHALSGRRRRLSLRNTEIAFPEKPLAERKALVKRSYVNLSESMAFNTLVTTGRLTNERILNCVETDDWGKIEALMASSPKGILFFSGHLGNWELMPQYAALRTKKNLHIISRQTNNQLLEDRIVRPLRERFGVNVFYKKNALLRIMKAVNKGEIAGFLIDQKLNLTQGIPVEFFGKVAGTTGAPALLQIRFDVTTLPVFMVKSAPRKYRLIIGDPVPWTDNGKPMDEQVSELTHIHQKIIEDMIREYPDQWFWMHNRWRLAKGDR